MVDKRIDKQIVAKRKCDLRGEAVFNTEEMLKKCAG